MRTRTLPIAAIAPVFTFLLIGSLLAASAYEASGGASLVLDGGFEQGSSNPSWNEFSSNFGSPLCTTAECPFGVGTGPHSGDWWAWFGGVNGTAEIGWVDQDIIIPAGSSTLSFWLQIPETAGTGSDFLGAFIDGTPVFSVTDLEASSDTNYSQVIRDVSTFGDCKTHILGFYSQTLGEGFTSFFVDDVTLEVVDPTTFCDLPTFHWAWEFVEAIFAAGLTSGFPDGTYGPDNPVTRAEMAVFLLRGIYGSTYTPMPINGGVFSDISGHWAEAWIEDLFDEGITSGFPDGTYRPENTATRAEMAVFLVRTFAIPLP